MPFTNQPLLKAKTTTVHTIIRKQILTGAMLLALSAGMWSCRSKETAPNPEPVTLVKKCLASKITSNIGGYELNVAKGNYDNSGKLVNAYYYNLESFVKNSTVVRKYNILYNNNGSLASSEYLIDFTISVTNTEYLVPKQKLTYTYPNGKSANRSTFNYSSLAYHPASKSYTTFPDSAGAVSQLVINTPTDSSVIRKTLMRFATDAAGNITGITQDANFNASTGAANFVKLADASYNSSINIPVNELYGVITPDIIDSLPFKYIPETFNAYKLVSGTPVIDNDNSFKLYVDAKNDATGMPATIRMVYLNGKATKYNLSYDFCN